MAEATGMRNNALPYPIYGAPFAIVYPMRDADGDLVTGATTPDAERSLNGDTFADCTNESTEIATSSGVYYLLLTAAEMTADITTVIAKSATSGMKTVVSTLYPRKLVTIRSGTSASGGASTSTIVLDGSASAVDDFYNGMVCIATIDSNIEVRVISDYTGSTQTATVVPDWNVAPDNNDTFVIKLPEGVQLNQANTTHISGAAVSTSSAQIGVNVINAAGTAWGSGAITAGSIASDAITAAKIATGAIDADAIASDAITAAKIAADAITAAKIADGAIDANTFAAGAITASAIAADAIGASELAADAVAEIADAVWDEDATGHQTQGTFGQAIGDPTSDSDTIWGLVNTNLNATVSSRASQTSVDTIDDFLDTEIAAILADTNELQVDWTNGGRLDLLIDAIKAKTDLVPGTQDGYTFAETILLMAAVLLGKASGLATTTAVYRSLDDVHDRITATVDGDGNRTAVTRDASSP